MAVDQPRAGTHYPRSVGEFQAWFGSDEDCLDYLEWLRWPTGFACAACEHRGAWHLGYYRLMCAGCGSRTSVTAGTIFDRTRTPLTVWFTACWLFATGKDGISALSLKRTLEISSYQTAWTMLHRDRERGMPLLTVREPVCRLEEVVLSPRNLSLVRNILREHNHEEVLRAHGLRPSDRLLFCGPPGCGKTLTAEVIAGELGRSFAIVRDWFKEATHADVERIVRRAIKEMVMQSGKPTLRIGHIESAYHRERARTPRANRR